MKTTTQSAFNTTFIALACGAIAGASALPWWAIVLSSLFVGFTISFGNYRLTTRRIVTDLPFRFRPCPCCDTWPRVTIDSRRRSVVVKVECDRCSIMMGVDMAFDHESEAAEARFAAVETMCAKWNSPDVRAVLTRRE